MLPHRPATKAMYGEDRSVEVDGYTLHYVEVGRGEPVLLVPGSYSTYRSWNRLIPLLRDHYRLLALDYLGAGDSDKPQSGFEYTIEEQADVIARMLPRLGLESVHLLGSSYGGAIVLNLAARYPGQVRRVVSIEGGIAVPEHMPGDPLSALLKYPLVGDLLIALTRSGLLRGLFGRLIVGEWYPEMTPEDRRDHAEELLHNGRHASRIVWYKVGTSAKRSRDFTQEARSIRAPVLYLYGERTDFRALVDANLRYFQEHLPHVRAVQVGAGIHDLAFQQPHRVAALTLEFLREGEAGRGQG